jgi:hypothetical protein
MEIEMKLKPLLPLIAACTLAGYSAEISKPTGCFTSTLTERAAANPALQGGLIRTTWAKLEPSPGIFDFSSIENSLRLLPKNKQWSLAVHGGWSSIDSGQAVKPPTFNAGAMPPRKPDEHMSPPWLVTECGAETFPARFRGYAVNIPKYWDPCVQQRLASMLQAVAEKYKDDERLKLVYVPQMTSNGLEGHFNGVPAEDLLRAAGLSAGQENKFELLWTQAALSAIRATASAFDNRAVAFELHELLGSADIPIRIMKEIQADPELKDQVGIGMWWISGKTDYQPDLVRALEKFTGDLYGQVIGRSDQTRRFRNGDYASVFEQAKTLGMRYIEPWNYEFENNTCNELMDEFNRRTRETFASGSSGNPSP